MKICELGDLEPVEQHLPSDAPRAQRRRLPVVLLEADVVFRQDDAQLLEAPQIDLLDIVGRGLQDDLELEVLSEAERVFAVTSVSRPARGLDIGAAPRFGAQNAEERRRVHRTGPDRLVVGLLDQAPFRLPEGRKVGDQPLQREHCEEVYRRARA